MKTISRNKFLLPAFLICALLFTFLFSTASLSVDKNAVYEFYYVDDKIATDTAIDRWGQYVPLRAYFEYCDCKVDWEREQDGSISALIFLGEGDAAPYFIFNTSTRKIKRSDVAGLIDAGGHAPIIRDDRMQFDTTIIENDLIDSCVFYDENGIMTISRRSYFRANEENVLRSTNLNDANKVTCTIAFDNGVEVNWISYDGQKAHYSGNLTYKNQTIAVEGTYERGKLLIYKKDNSNVILFDGKQAHNWGIQGDFYDETSGEKLRCSFELN